MIYISALSALAILAVPFVNRKELDIFHPFALFSVSFTVGGLARTSHYVVNYSSTNLPYGLSLANLKTAVVVLLISFTFLIFGFYTRIGKKIYPRFIVKIGNSLDYNLVKYLSVLLFFLGIYFFFVFVTSIYLGDVLYQLSSKRSIKSGYLMWGVEMIYVSFILIYTVEILRGSNKFIYRLIMVVSFVIYLSVGFLMSRRGMILKGFLVPAAIYHYGKAKIGTIKVITGGTAFLLLFTLMAGVRRKTISGIYGTYEFIKNNFLDELYSSFVEGHYLFDITTVATTIRDVPGSLNFQYGKTLITWILMPVPRSVWQEKPTAVGQLIGGHIYDQGVGKIGGGVPPPIVADFYLNYSLIGVVIGMFSFGVFVRASQYLIKKSNTNFLTLVSYSLLLVTMISMFNGGFSKPIVGFLKMYVPILAICWISSMRWK